MTETDRAALDVEFLAWLRLASEAAWRNHVPSDFNAAGVGGLDWKSGTRWRGGMTDAEISAAETRYGLTFPPDYRLFLATLHTPDPPMIGAHYEDSGLVPTSGRKFPDWTGRSEPIESALVWPVEGLVSSIDHDESWHDSWGPRPRGRKQRGRLVRELVAAGPQLVPVFGHRYLAGPGDRAGNPVLSIYGSDVIVYAPGLRAYLPSELGLSPPSTPGYESAGTEEPIPFWQDVIDGLSGAARGRVGRGRPPG
jgi:hypothetical protein